MVARLANPCNGTASKVYRSFVTFNSHWSSKPQDALASHDAGQLSRSLSRFQFVGTMFVPM